MNKIPFDYCDECGKKILIPDPTTETVFLCKECQEMWWPADAPDDDYDRITKNEDDQ